MRIYTGFSLSTFAFVPLPLPSSILGLTPAVGSLWNRCEGSSSGFHISDPILGLLSPQVKRVGRSTPFPVVLMYRFRTPP